MQAALGELSGMVCMRGGARRAREAEEAAILADIRRQRKEAPLGQS